MQDRYAGDVGDFGKFALLRALANDRRIGVCWYRTDGSLEKNLDGRHTAYLNKRDEYRFLDPNVFDALSDIKSQSELGKQRSIAQLEAANLLKTAIYHDGFVPPSKIERSQWKNEMCAKVNECDFVFLDPDNGLSESGFSIKHVRLDEIQTLRRQQRSLLLYCHQDRTKGGAGAFVEKLRDRLRSVGVDSTIVVRLRPGTSRCYVLMDYDKVLQERAEEFVRCWKVKAELF
jgi:hypothetical protein